MNFIKRLFVSNKRTEQHSEQNAEETIYRTILIKKLIAEIEDNKKEITELKQHSEQQRKEINKLHELVLYLQSSLKTNSSEQQQQELTQLEKRIYTQYINIKPDTLEQLAAATKTKITSLKVYVSKIRGKGYDINFNK